MTSDMLTLTDSASGAAARILPARGFNCVSFQVPQADGTNVEVLWAAPDFVSGHARPASSGIPLLFPFPGRLGGTHFSFEGRSYELEPGDAFGNAIHGFVLDRPWRILTHSEREAVGQFTASRDAPELLDRWPADFQLTATYKIAGGQLSLGVLVENIGEGPLPFGFGTHPYFRLPLGGGDAAACRVTVPVETCWELKDMLPTGRVAPSPEAARLRQGMPFGEAHFDHVFAGLQFQRGSAAATIHDPQSGRTMALIFDDVFRECVVYTPGHREAICIEPYTCVPDAYRLQAAGHDTGLRILQPGAKFHAAMEIVVS